jgi:hypothetical protein
MRKVNRHLLSRFLMLTMLCYLVRTHNCSSVCRTPMRGGWHQSARCLQCQCSLCGSVCKAPTPLLKSLLLWPAGPHELGVCSAAAEQGPWL